MAKNVKYFLSFEYEQGKQLNKQLKIYIMTPFLTLFYASLCSLTCE